MATEPLSGLESIMWRLGHDAALRMTVGNLMILDRLPATGALLERLEALAANAPRLRQRIEDPTHVRTRPTWVERPDFDATDHLRAMAVPPPGNLRQVLDLVALVEAAPFDPDRPPWEVTVIEGLDGGKAALYLRAHHAMTDGMGGRSLLDLMLDPPEATPSSPSEHDGDAAPDAGAGGDGALVSGTRKPGTLTVTIDLTSAARPVAAGLARARDVDPVDTLLRGLRRSVGLADSISRQMLVAGAPLSPLPPARAMSSRFEVLSVHGARAAALALGGSRNDLLVAATAAGLGLYHERLGLPCPELRLAMPASRHREGSAGGNWFAPTRVEIPTASDHPGPQFGVVAERLARARSEPAVRLTSGLASAISHLPTRVLLPALHAQANSVDFVATSLPGIRSSRQLCGATIEGSYPFGPRLRCLANVTASGNEDRLDIGIGLDPVAIAEPDVFVECLTAAFGRFLPAGQAGSRSRGRSASTAG